ncbi:MAG: hypothetical protein FWH27_16900 [Planctomycetaceae bacterium]|nr:hypothetical protein [Planctomycetaceae bacterium]
MKTKALMLVLLFLVFATGCSGKKKKEVTIQGTVTVAGKAVDAGLIQFIPVNQDGFEGGGLIRNGKFTATVPYGEMRVRFQGNEYEKKDAEGNPLGGEVKTDANGMVTVIDPPSRRIIPDRYWKDSDVRVTVENAKQKFDFDLDAQ